LFAFAGEEAADVANVITNVLAPRAEAPFLGLASVLARRSRRADFPASFNISELSSFSPQKKFKYLPGCGS